MISLCCFRISQFINFLNFEGFIYYIFNIDPSKSLACFVWKNFDYYTHYISFSLEEYGKRDPFYVRYFNFRKFSKKPRIHIV
jgi:hypothetical protein